MALFLQILKITGIVLLCVLALVILLLLLVLFVPIRYRIEGERKVPDEAPVRVTAKVTWLLHLLSVAFRYPEEAYIKVKVLGIKVFSTEKKEAAGEAQKEKSKSSNGKRKKEAEADGATEADGTKQVEQTDKNTVEVKEENTKKTDCAADGDTVDADAMETVRKENDAEEMEEEPTLFRFFHKLWDILQNIKYTICKIYDKIREVIKNIRYYIKVIQSDTFQRTFGLCKNELFQILSHILPGKLHGEFVIGTGDPASTAQILAIHGILYPLIGNHITIIPDFENAIVKGDFFIRGRVTVFRLLKTAIKIYFNRDVRRVIRLLKREAAVNGRK